MANKEQNPAERLRYWKLSKAAHKLKNRSSKSILKIHHQDKIDIYRSLSGAVLERMARNDNFDAEQEILRRSKIHEKNQIRKQRYLEKLEAKRAKKVA